MAISCSPLCARALGNYLTKGFYFKLIWKTAHLYQVEDDYTLTLVDLSPQALHWGVLAPERVTPDLALFKKLQTAFKTLPA
jgi:hypothetical protein